MAIIESIFNKLGYSKIPKAKHGKGQSKLAQKANLDFKKVATRLIVPSYLSNTSFGITPELSWNELTKAYTSWVYTCIDKIAKTIPTYPFKIYTYRRPGNIKIVNFKEFKYALKRFDTMRDRKIWLKDQNINQIEIADHVSFEVLNRPNNLMTRFMLWYETIMRLELGGLSAWYLIKDKILKLPREIMPLPLTSTASLKAKPNKSGMVDFWIYKDGDILEYFKPEDLLIFKYPSPQSPYEGFSPVMAQKYPYDIDYYLMLSQKALYENGIMPGASLSTDRELTRDQVEEILDEIKEQFAGASNNGEPMLYHSGLKPYEPSWSPEDSMANSTAKWARDKILTAYDTSAGKVGLVEDVNRANMEALDDSYTKECSKPKCMLLEEVLEAFFYPLYDDGISCEFILPDIEDRALNIQERESNLRTFYSSINQELEKEGKPPVPWGDKPWIPFGMTQYGEDGFLTQEPPSPPSKKSVIAEEKANRSQLRAEWALFNSRLQKWENLISQQLTNYFKIQGEDVIKKLGSQWHRTEAQYHGWSRKRVLEHIKTKGIGDDINIIKNDEIEELQILLKPNLEAALKEGGDILYQRLGLGIYFNLADPQVQKWLGTRLEMFSREVTNNTFDDIKAILREGISQGQPLATITETLREKFVSYEKYRAPLIARTESMAALNKSDILAIKQARIEDKLLKFWLSAGDGNVRDTHRIAERRYSSGIPISEPFVVGADTMDAPGNGSLPEENINCRCTCGYKDRR